MQRGSSLVRCDHASSAQKTRTANMKCKPSNIKSPVARRAVHRNMPQGHAHGSAAI